MYKQSSRCKINCRYTATKRHICPDKTDRTRSWYLLQKTDSDSGSKRGLWGTSKFDSNFNVSFNNRSIYRNDVNLSTLSGHKLITNTSV